MIAATRRFCDVLAALARYASRASLPRQADWIVVAAFIARRLFASSASLLATR